MSQFLELTGALALGYAIRSVIGPCDPLTTLKGLVGFGVLVGLVVGGLYWYLGEEQ